MILGIYTIGYLYHTSWFIGIPLLDYNDSMIPRKKLGSIIPYHQPTGVLNTAHLAFQFNRTWVPVKLSVKVSQISTTCEQCWLVHRGPSIGLWTSPQYMEGSIIPRNHQPTEVLNTAHVSCEADFEFFRQVAKQWHLGDTLLAKVRHRCAVQNLPSGKAHCRLGGSPEKQQGKKGNGLYNPSSLEIYFGCVGI